MTIKPSCPENAVPAAGSGMMGFYRYSSHVTPFADELQMPGRRISPRPSQALPNRGAASAPSWMKGISYRAALHTGLGPEWWIITPQTKRTKPPMAQEPPRAGSSSNALTGREPPDQGGILHPVPQGGAQAGSRLRPPVNLLPAAFFPGQKISPAYLRLLQEHPGSAL